MRLKFWRKPPEVKDVGGSAIVLPGIGKISTDRLYNYILAFKLSDVIYSCITKIQLAAILVPWYVYQKKGDQVIEITDHPLVDFLKRPGARMSWSRYIEKHLGYLLLTGNSYQWPIVPSFKTKLAVTFLRPDRVTPKLTMADAITYDYWKRGILTRFQEEDIIHIKLFNPEEDEDHLEGLSPVASIAKSVDIASYAQEWMFRLLEKGAQPALSLATDNNMTEDQKRFLKEQIKSDVLGSENVLNPLILEGGLKPVKIGLSPQELNYDPLTKSIVRKVASVYKVPSQLLDDSESKTYANVQEAEKALYYKATLPHLTTLRDELNSWVVPKFDDTGNIFFDYDISGIDALSEDMEKIWERAGKAVDRGVLTRNQALEMMKYGKSKYLAADKLTVMGAVMPLDVVTGDSAKPIVKIQP